MKTKTMLLVSAAALLLNGTAYAFGENDNQPNSPSTPTGGKDSYISREVDHGSGGGEYGTPKVYEMTKMPKNFTSREQGSGMNSSSDASFSPSAHPNGGGGGSSYNTAN